MSWFKQIFGTEEDIAKISVNGKIITVNNKQYHLGEFLIVRPNSTKIPYHVYHPARLSNIVGEISQLQSNISNNRATFQVASQFNAQEYVSPIVVLNTITPYINDKTQGPAASISCAPAALYRNYYLKSLNMLDIFERLIGNNGNKYFVMKNGYLLSTIDRLILLNDYLRSISADSRTVLKNCIKTVVVYNTQVVPSNQLITQVYCSAPAISYSPNNIPADLWIPLTTLILEAHYESTFIAAIRSASSNVGYIGSNKLYLTTIGGGVFGVDRQLIHSIIINTFNKYKQYSLDVYIVTFG